MKQAIEKLIKSYVRDNTLLEEQFNLDSELSVKGYVHKMEMFIDILQFHIEENMSLDNYILTLLHYCQDTVYLVDGIIDCSTPSFNCGVLHAVRKVGKDLMDIAIEFHLLK